VTAVTGPSLLQSAAALGAALAVNAARRAAIALASYLAAGLLLAASLSFLTFSAYRAISLALGDIYAALIVGSAYLVAALIVLVILCFKGR
jgi:hypothetical protein